MHQTILVKRKAEAAGRLKFAAEALANTLSLDPEVVAGLNPVGIKDSHVREMMFLEGAANLITAVAIKEGAIKESAPVSVETPEPEAAATQLDAESEFLRPTEQEPASKKPAAKKSTRKGARK
jgi:hypothetical protein